MAYKDFAPAQILTAQEVDTYLMRQTVMSFATSTARDAAITTPVEGMVAYLLDSNTFWYYDGSAWTNLGNVMRYASYALRATLLPSPVEGMISYLQDTDELEVYNGTSWLRLVVTSDDESLTIAGDLTVDTSSLKVDAANDVIGIMTSTPSTGQYNDWSVDIASGRVRIGGNRNGGTAGVALGTGTPTGTWYSNTAFMGLEGTANTSSVGFWHHGAWRLLAANTGQVTLPSQPYFSGQLAGGNQVVNGAWIPQTVHINNGSRFNTSNGRFTPGVAGYVLCCFASLINTPLNTSHAYVYFTVDGAEKSVRVHTDYNQPRSYEPLANVAVVYVPSSSSFVECQVRCVDSGALYGAPWGGGLSFALLG